MLIFSRATQLRERDVLQLTNPLPRDTEFFADFLKRLRFAAVEPEAIEDDYLFAPRQHVEQAADLKPVSDAAPHRRALSHARRCVLRSPRLMAGLRARAVFRPTRRRSRAPYCN